MADDDILRFHPGDYAVFFLGIIAAASVGVVQGFIDMWNDRKKEKAGGSKEEETDSELAQRNLSIWPASLSIMGSVTAAPFVLGVPAEIYTFGTMFALIAFAYLIGVPVLTHFFFERWYKMQIASMYEYLEIRYAKPIRSLATGLFALAMLLYMGVIVYAPALAFNQVSGISLTLCIIIVGVVGIVYTVIGGLKGVLWVDAIQMLIILAVVLAINIRGTLIVGGIGKVWEMSDKGGRLQFSEWDLNPKVRHSEWTQILGGFFFVVVMFSNQSVVQKVLGLPSLKEMHVTSYISMAAIFVYIVLFSFAGLVIYAYYRECDPLMNQKITKGDQLMPYFVLEVFHDAPGVAGLFTAAVFGATLSSVAAGINALAAVTLLDVVGPLVKSFNQNKNIGKRMSATVFKSLVVFYGVVTIGLAFMTPLLGSGVVQMALSIMGTIGAPTCALFFIGVFCPFVNSIGAAVGCVISLLFTVWLNVGAIITGGATMTANPLSRVTTGCSSVTAGNSTLSTAPLTTTSPMTALKNTSEAELTIQSGGVVEFYKISYMWYSAIGFMTCVVVAIIVSAATGFRRGKPVNPEVAFACCCYNTDGGERKITKLDLDHKQSVFTYNGSANFPEGSPSQTHDNTAYAQDDVKLGCHTGKISLSNEVTRM